MNRIIVCAITVCPLLLALYFEEEIDRYIESLDHIPHAEIWVTLSGFAIFFLYLGIVATLLDGSASKRILGKQKYKDIFRVKNNLQESQSRRSIAGYPMTGKIKNRNVTIRARVSYLNNDKEEIYHKIEVEVSDPECEFYVYPSPKKRGHTEVYWNKKLKDENHIRTLYENTIKPNAIDEKELKVKKGSSVMQIWIKNTLRSKIGMNKMQQILDTMLEIAEIIDPK